MCSVCGAIAHPSIYELLLSEIMSDTTLQSVERLINPRHAFTIFVICCQPKDPFFYCPPSCIRCTLWSTTEVISTSVVYSPLCLAVQQVAVGLNFQLQAGFGVQQPLVALGVRTHQEQLLLQAAQELLHLGQLAAVVALGLGQRVLQGFLLHVGEKRHRQNNGGNERRKVANGLT